ncbi:serine hydrolase [marine bacterium AO1-C]|nr:serine hydrolase [marine bacterium AO1-C]
MMLGCQSPEREENQNQNEKQESEPFAKLTTFVDRYAQHTLKKGHINSLAVAVYRNGKTYHNYYGEIDPGANNLPNDSTLYEIASISKVFVGSLAAKAALEGKINLDDDIRKYLDGEYPNLTYKGTPVTIKNLLTHTLGFGTPPKLQEVNKKTKEGYYENRAFDYSMDDLLSDLKNVEVKKKPGTFYDYNNVGPELVTYILTKVYKRPYKELLLEFLAKLDMKNTYLQEYDRYKKRISNGYGEDQKKMPLLKNQLSGGAYGILATLPDLVKFMKFQLESKDPFIKESVRSLFKNDDEQLGYLWDIGFAKKEGFYYLKTGSSLGIQSVILLCPDSNYGMVLVMNNNSEVTMNDWLSLYNKAEYDLIEYPKVNLWSTIEPMFMNKPKEAIKKYLALKKDTATYFASPGYLNKVGYDLLSGKQVQKAIEVFKFAVSEAPDNANLYDSLGEAYFIAKDYRKSRESYKKSLELNPKNNHAKKTLLKIDKLLKS